MAIPDALCAQIAAKQHGLVTLRQAVEAGMTLRMTRGRVQSGLWARRRPGVFAIAGSPSSWQQDLFALVLWGRAGTMAAGRAAAALWDLRGFQPGALEISSPQRLRDPGDGSVIHLQSPYLAHEPVDIQGIPTGSIEKTIYELTNYLGQRTASIAFDDALRRGMTTLERQWDFIQSIARQGRHNIRPVREMIELRDRRYEIVRSDSESTLLPLFDGITLPKAEVDYSIFDHGRLVAVADFAYPNEKFDIESDGHSVHSSEVDLLRDKRRDRALVRLGWTVVRFTREEALNEKPRVIADIRAVLTQLGHPFFSKRA